MIIVSACLAGVKCRYDGRSKPSKKIINLIKKGKAIPICPEQLGGLSTPRNACEQKGDKVFTKDGKDLTFEFQKGAEEGLKIALLVNCKKAILKSKSPTCSSSKIYDGSFSRNLIDGEGVFCKLLRKHNIKVYDENNF